jgi:hypothetical protein
MENKTTDWIQTFTGKQFFPLEPDIELIDLMDIAHALSLQCRFAGHCRHFYSVGQHSLIVASLAPPEYILEALLHDAAEAYLGDISRPVKAFMRDYRFAEFRLRLAIEERFSLKKDNQALIHRLDDTVLYWEGKYLMPDVAVWNIAKPIQEIEAHHFVPSSSVSVRDAFLNMARKELERR